LNPLSEAAMDPNNMSGTAHSGNSAASSALSASPAPDDDSAPSSATANGSVNSAQLSSLQVGPAAPAATVNGDIAGTQLQISDVRRRENNLVKLRFTIINNSDKLLEIGSRFCDPNKPDDAKSVSACVLIASGKKYAIWRDAKGVPRCSKNVDDIPPGSRTSCFANFTAPPAGLTKVTVSVPHFPPVPNVPISSAAAVAAQ
jgi:hypothetical protein